MAQYLVFVGAAVGFFFGILPYLINTLKGKTKPNKVSWLIWAVAPLIGAAAAFSAGLGFLADNQGSQRGHCFCDFERWLGCPSHFDKIMEVSGNGNCCSLRGWCFRQPD